MYQALLNHSPVEGYLGFQLGAIMDKVRTGMCVQVFA